jgi:alanine racemase
MTRPLKARINLNAFRHNYIQAKALQGGHCVAVVKANAYGHGAVACAQAIQDIADAFAVASLSEAKQLRQAGIVNPILLLEGFFDAAELSEIVEYDCWLVIHSDWQVRALLNSGIKHPLSIWLKIDTGMHRLGFAPDCVMPIYVQLCESQCVANIVLMTHFANADNDSRTDTTQQIEAFTQMLKVLKAEHHPEKLPVSGFSLSNSAAILAWSETLVELFTHDEPNFQTWSRPGIMLYGASPVTDQSSQAQLLSVMHLTSRIIAIQTVNAGESIGYGSIFTATHTTRVGVVACGYADGYPRSATHAPVLVGGVESQVIGRVSMDMLFIDLTDIPHVNIGDEVELWGDNIDVNTVARVAGTIAYELFCNVKRAELVYENEIQLN